MNINNKAVIWATMLAMSACTFTACSNDTDNESNTAQGVDSTSTELIEEYTTEPLNSTGMFIDINRDDYSVSMTFDEIYEKNEISAEPIANIGVEGSGLYYELNLKITSEDIEKLRDSTGAYVAELDISTSALTDCGDAVGGDDKTVVIMFGDKNLLDADYLSQAFNIDNETRTMFIKGEFRGMTALYPMLVESEGNKVYVFKPFLEMSKAW